MFFNFEGPYSSGSPGPCPPGVDVLDLQLLRNGWELEHPERIENFPSLISEPEFYYLC